MTVKQLGICLGLLLALSAPYTLAGFDEANAAFEAADYAKAQAELQPLLEKHDPRAQYAMGVLYENGFGVAKDLPQAAAWYLKAQKQYPQSDFATEAIGRLVRRVLPEG